ncbi:MAG: hypothetical protein HQK76_01175 [Desulfobacterales bacterium]|nr:hypothetical protein [Desulfobacterales bacterium]
MEIIKFRCTNCGTLLQSPSDNEGKKGICSNCKKHIIIPHLPNKDQRKSERFLSEKNIFSPSNFNQKDNNDCNDALLVVYTEADPTQFAIARKYCAPLIDICKDGLAFIINKKGYKKDIKANQLISIKIDFPILIMPLDLMIQAQWVKNLAYEDLLRIGGQFCDASDEEVDIIKNLTKYVQSRPKGLNYVNEPVVLQFD